MASSIGEALTIVRAENVMDMQAAPRTIACPNPVSPATDTGYECIF